MMEGLAVLLSTGFLGGTAFTGVSSEKASEAMLLFDHKFGSFLRAPFFKLRAIWQRVCSREEDTSCWLGGVEYFRRPAGYLGWFFLAFTRPPLPVGI
jgi:hypothetical protein